VRARPILLIVAAAILIALATPASGAASSGGGAVAAPNGDEGGGTAFGTPAPSAKRSRRAARRRRAPAPAPAPLPPGEHVFPVAGVYDLGGEGALFGARRRAHRHMGHDVAAALGTPVVAPYAGTVEWVRFQRGGAGHYVVLDADDGHDYVFMHLRRGSIPVTEGQVVAAGAQLGEVGNSGRSFGAHLHFEVWTGGWYEKGGEPIDPLPFLQDWATR
jgi:murein DD-endopeptidase MepM/ murein hydrolase activator NlpD